MVRETGNTRRSYIKRVGAIGAVALAGCSGDGNGNGDTPTSEDTPTESEDTPTEGGTMEPQPDVTLTATATHPSEGSNLGEFLALFKEVVESNSDSITIDAYFNGELAGAVEELEGVSGGSIDIGTGFEAAITASVLGFPDLRAYNFPYLFNSFEEALSATRPENSDFASEMKQRMIDEADVRQLTWYAFGERNFSTVDTEVYHPDDVSGLRIRGPSGDMYQAVIRGLGGEAVLMDYGEVSTALATGSLDGVEQILWALQEPSITENIEYVIRTHHILSPMGCYINDGTFQNLTSTQQEELMNAARQTTEEHLPEAIDRMEGMTEQIRNAGVEIINEDSGLDNDAFEESIQSEVQSAISNYDELEEAVTAPLN